MTISAIIMTRLASNNKEKHNRRKRFLIGQLGKYGDCLFATTVAKQIKNDYPDCHLTWAIGSIYRTILDGNPYIDEIWEFPLPPLGDLSESWQQFECEAIKRKRRGDFDEIFLTQLYPNNFKNFDGTVRSSILRAYPTPITVSVSPVLRLTPKEIENVRSFSEEHHLLERKHVILFECSFDSGQSFLTADFAYEVSKKIIEKISDVSIILSSKLPIQSVDENIINGSVLTFRENAELTKYCTLVVGCSSGISWLCTSDWAKPLPMVQLLKRDTGAYASFVQDHKYHGLPSDMIIEMTDCSVDKLTQCLNVILTEGFDLARQKYHERIRINLKHYVWMTGHFLLKNKKYKETMISARHTAKRWFLDALFR
jgi:hypothetical protein